ncbi:MAG: 16S rRNA (cytidine(1402)-2'-O)-methyltransferase, partial [Candidatus Saccharibacteria bacterium]|nr:16S rRNA (cytidine(1402)-2'-O)-methyltransferase [Candidatus Saccharibacteria bacterium]
MQIQRSFKDESTYGELYLVATPIGNMQDTSTRMLGTLEKVDLIAAEDTRTTGYLLDYFGIENKQISFNDHNAKERIPELIALLKEGKRI